MQMVRHEQKQIWPPQRLFLSMTDGFKQSFGDIRQGELVPKTFFAVDAYEIDFLLRVNPRRNLVRQGFASPDWHGWRIGHKDQSWQGVGRDIALRCPRRVQRRNSFDCECRSEICSACHRAKPRYRRCPRPRQSKRNGSRMTSESRHTLRRCTRRGRRSAPSLPLDGMPWDSARHTFAGDEAFR